MFYSCYLRYAFVQTREKEDFSTYTFAGQLFVSEANGCLWSNVHYMPLPLFNPLACSVGKYVYYFQFKDDEMEAERN